MRQANTWMREALDSMTGALIFAIVVAVSGAVVGVVGWVAGSYPTVGLVLGCAILSTLVAPLISGLLNWGVDELQTERVASSSPAAEKTFKRAA